MRRIVLALVIVLSGLSGAAQAQLLYRGGPVYHRPFHHHYFHHRHIHHRFFHHRPIYRHGGPFQHGYR